MSSNRSRSRVKYLAGFLIALLQPFGPSAQAAPENKKTEIVLIAAHHVALFLHPRYTPAHVRALLTKVNPHVLCLESLQDWQHPQPIPTFPQEHYSSITWAKKRNVPVYGVDWESAEWGKFLAAQQQLQSSTTREKRWQSFQRGYRDQVTWESMQAFGESNTQLEFLHSLKGAAEAESIFLEALSLEERAEHETRDDHITQNILRIASRYPGKRVAVILGAAHYARQTRRLRAQPSVQLISTTEFLPLSSKEVQAGWHPDDAIVLLGANLDSSRIPGAPQSRNHQRSKELLDKLALTSPNSPITRYYRARWKFLMEDLGEAKTILEGIVEENTQVAIPYEPDRRWCWPPFSKIDEKAKFTLATIHDLEGKHDQAAIYYRQLLNLEPPTLLKPRAWRRAHHDLTSYLNSLIEDPYRGGLWEVFRAQETLRYE